MEANKLDAMECIRRAEEMMKSHCIRRNATHAQGLLEKSIRLYPTERAKELLGELSSGGAHSKHGGKHDTPDASDPANLRHRFQMMDSSANDSLGRSDEQKEAMDKVRKANTLYEMLDVQADASTAEITRAYKRLALLLHPDKNKVSGAADCFKAIAKAFKVLGDESTRAQYNASMCSTVDEGSYFANGRFPRYSQFAAPGQFYANGSPFNVWSSDDDFSAEDFFNTFFGMRNGYVVRPSSHCAFRSRVFRRHVPPQEPSNYLLKYASMAVFMVLMVFAAYLTPDNVFQFDASETHSLKRVTSRLRITYFVRPQFSISQSELGDFESRVESAGLLHLEDRCKEELRVHYIQAKLSGRRNIERDPARVSTPSCNLYRKLAVRLAQMSPRA